MTATATFDEIENAQARNKVEAGERWQQLILDTKQGIQRDPQESLSIMTAVGKSINDLRTAVKRLQEIASLQEELRTLRTHREDFRKYTQEQIADQQAFAQQTAEHNKRQADLTHKINVAHAKRQRVDAVVARLKDLGMQCSETVVDDLRRSIDQLRGTHARTLNDIKREQEFVDAAAQNLENIATSLDRMVGGDDRKPRLKQEHDAAARSLERDKGDLQKKRDSAKNLLKQIEERESRLKALREQLLIDPHAEI